MVKSKGKIKASKPKKGPRISAITVEDPSGKPVIFSFERIEGSHCFSDLSKDEKAQVAEAMFKRKNMRWVDIIQAGRHALGQEKISRNSIKSGIPRFITDDVNFFNAIRFDGKKAMVGHLIGNIFYIIWLDAKFTLYKH